MRRPRLRVVLVVAAALRGPAARRLARRPRARCSSTRSSSPLVVGGALRARCCCRSGSRATGSRGEVGHLAPERGRLARSIARRAACSRSLFGTLAIAAVVWLARVEPRWWWAIAVAGVDRRRAAPDRGRAGAARADLPALAAARAGPAARRPARARVARRRRGRIGARARGGRQDRVGERRRHGDGADPPDRAHGHADRRGAAASDASIAEVRAVLGHELGHHRSGDLWRFAVLGAVSTFVSFGVAAWLVDRLPGALAHGGPQHARRPAGARALPRHRRACRSVARQAAYSRRRERAADAFGFEVAGDPEAFARALEGLCRTNLAEYWPPRLVQLRASHPAPGERIARARGSAAPGRDDRHFGWRAP